MAMDLKTSVYFNQRRRDVENQSKHLNSNKGNQMEQKKLNPMEGYDPDKELDDMCRAAARPKIVLRPLAVTDLSLRYARNLGDGKIIHYRVSALQSILGVPGFDPFTMVKDHILEFEPSAEVELADSLKISDGLVGDVSAKVLTPQIRADLEKRKMNCQLMQYYDIPNGPGFFQKLAHFASRFPRLKRYIPSKYIQRRVSPASYLSYTYEAPDEELAIKAMRQDLQILSDKGLILGHIVLPSTLYLADTVGSGVHTKALFCFLFVDQHKLLKELGLDSLVKMPKLPLRELGIRSENLEGGLGQHLSNGRNYQIEEVSIEMGMSEASRKAYVQNYLQNREIVNEAAARQNEDLKNTTVSVESFTSEDDRKVRVHAKFSK